MVCSHPRMNDRVGWQGWGVSLPSVSSTADRVPDSSGSAHTHQGKYPTYGKKAPTWVLARDTPQLCPRVTIHQEPELLFVAVPRCSSHAFPRHLHTWVPAFSASNIGKKFSFSLLTGRCVGCRAQIVISVWLSPLRLQRDVWLKTVLGQIQSLSLSQTCRCTATGPLAECSTLRGLGQKTE